MELSAAYDAVRCKLEGMDFDRLWPGFRQYDFALYDEATAVLRGEAIPKPEEFWGNTALEYEGEQIAIWNMAEPLDLDILASKLVHEMFHAHQLALGDQRFVNENAAVSRCCRSEEYLWALHQENLLLSRLFDACRPEELEAYLSCRKARQREFPWEYGYESAVEAIEGAAQYVELQALEQLDPEKRRAAVSRLLDRVRDPCRLFPIRPLCYDTGALFLLVLLENGLPVDQSLAGASLPYGQALVDSAAGRSLPAPAAPAFRAIYEREQQSLRRRADSIRSRCPQPIRGEFQLEGFNCYAPRSIDGYIFSDGFLACRRDGGQTVYFSGDCLFRLEAGRVTEIFSSENPEQ